MRFPWTKKKPNTVLVPPNPKYFLENIDRKNEFYPPWDEPNDQPLACLYRIYADILSARDLGMRTEIEYFFNKHKWSVSAIPDPKDPEVERYAVIAAITYVLVAAFNKLISMGLPRDAPAIIASRKQEEQLKARPHKLEKAPVWAENVPALEEALRIPDATGKVPTNAQDPSADPYMIKKNILTTMLHIFFI